MRLRARYAVAPLAVALILTGCARPGTAATVDGHRITDAEVASLTNDLATLEGEATSQTALGNLINAHAVLETVEEHGLGVSEQQGVELLDAVAAQGGVEPWDYSDVLVLVARYSLAADALRGDPAAMDDAVTRLKGLDVSLNPRFGTWSGETGVVEPVWPWLTTPQAEGAGQG